MAQPDNALIDRLAQQERAGDINGALSVLNGSGLTPAGFATVALSLYRRNLAIVPFILAEKLIASGFDNWALHVLAAQIGPRVDRRELAAKSLARLSQLFANASDADRRALRDLLDPALPFDAASGINLGDYARVKALMPLWTLAEPDAARRFAQPPAGREPDVARFHQQGDPTRLYQYATPPTGVPRVARTVIIGMRHLWMPGVPTSREHDLPPRIAEAFERYGWKTVRHDLRGFDDPSLVEDYQALAALCRAHDADVLLLDDFMPSRGRGATGEIIQAVRHELPRLRVMGAYFDPWQPHEWDDMEAGAALLDCAWTNIPTGVWKRPALAERTLFLAIPHGGEYPIAPPVQPGFRFAGGVQYSNWDRAFWLAALNDSGLLTSNVMSKHAKDDLHPLASYRAYMMRQAASPHASISLARRANGLSTITGRTSETLATGNLLIQERSDDIDGFFVANRHYLRFETITDLHDIAHLIRTEPDYVEAIRQEGAAFFRERYSDERMASYFDYFLFHRARGASDVAA
jgi:hypothetical protein